MDMTTNEKLDMCDRFRKVGNLMYEQGQYESAAQYYYQAILYFEYVFPENEHETERLQHLRLCSLLNLSACLLKNFQYEEVIHYATQALEVDPSHVKAYFRCAFLHDGDDLSF